MNTPCEDDMLKCAFIFCCLVGLRYSDVKKLVWNDLYEDNEGAIILRIRVTKTKRCEDFPISKELALVMGKSLNCLKMIIQTGN